MVRASVRDRNAEQRIQRRRTQILEAAASVFARKGFHRSTTREIAAEAGVAEGTIYNYFESKRDLLIAMVAKLASENLFKIMERADTMDARALLTEILWDRMALIDRNRDAVQVVIHELIVDEDLRKRYFAQLLGPFAQQVLAYFGKCIEAGTFRRFDPRIIVPALAGGTLLSILITSEGRSIPVLGAASPDREEVITELVDFFLHGISASPRTCEREMATEV